MDGKNKASFLRDQITALFRDQKSKALLLIGLLGMSLILLSAFFPGGASAKKNPPACAEEADYIQRLELRLTGIVGSVEGVGRCEVMVTAQSGVEYVYAVEESQTTNQTNRYEGDEVRRETQQENSDQKYIIVDAGGGKKEALLKTQRQPAIQGVVVVCEGAGSMVVQERVTQVVTTALGIPYHKVCVTKISK